MSARAAARFLLAILIAIDVLAAGAGDGIKVTNRYTTAPAFGGIGFDEPVQVVFAPGEANRAFVVERGGTIWTIPNLERPQREPFVELGKLEPAFTRQLGLLTMAFHPRFAENGFIYVWYSFMTQGRRANRLARLQLSAPERADSRITLVPLLTQPTGPQGHDGATLLFGADGYLYLSLGDGDDRQAEPAASNQRIDRSFFGAVLRIDVDMRPENLPPNPHPAVHAGTYRVPADNPFVGAKSFLGAAVAADRVRTEFWCIGLRNPWRMAFDPETGALWCGDIGLKAREEIDVLVAGGNYGWNFREGSVRGPRGGTPRGAQFVEPVWEYQPPVGMSVTGGFVYRGRAYADLVGKYLFADYVMGRIWALTPDGAKPVAAAQVEQIAAAPTVVAFAQDPRTDEVLLTSLGGEIFRLVPKDAGTRAR